MDENPELLWNETVLSVTKILFYILYLVKMMIEYEDLVVSVKVLLLMEWYMGIWNDSLRTLIYTSVDDSSSDMTYVDSTLIRAGHSKATRASLYDKHTIRYFLRDKPVSQTERNCKQCIHQSKRTYLNNLITWYIWNKLMKLTEIFTYSSIQVCRIYGADFQKIIWNILVSMPEHPSICIEIRRVLTAYYLLLLIKVLNRVNFNFRHNTVFTYVYKNYISTYKVSY